MKSFCVFCAVVLSCLWVSNGTAAEFVFSGQFKDGSSRSDYHSFALTDDSEVFVQVNSTCDLSDFYLGIDDDDSGFFTDTFGRSSPENDVSYGTYPLAGGKSYRVWVQCTGHNQEDYTITVTHLKYSLDAPSYSESSYVSKDIEPNNNKSTASIVGSVGAYRWIEGHLGFMFDTHESYNNDTRDGLDYFTAELEAGEYRLSVDSLGQNLLKHAPYVPSLRISDKNGFNVVFLEDLTEEGVEYEFYVKDPGTYFFSVVSSSVVTQYTDKPYGGYYISLRSYTCDAQLDNLDVEDSVCGLSATISAYIVNSCSSSLRYEPLKYEVVVSGPAYTSKMTYIEDDMYLSPGTKRIFNEEWEIQENLFTGKYRVCLGIYVKNPRFTGERWQEEWLMLDRDCKRNYVLCNKKISINSIMFLLNATRERTKSSLR